jgi:hypothetical protein
MDVFVTSLFPITESISSHRLMLLKCIIVHKFAGLSNQDFIFRQEK